MRYTIKGFRNGVEGPCVSTSNLSWSAAIADIKCFKYIDRWELTKQPERNWNEVIQDLIKEQKPQTKA